MDHLQVIWKRHRKQSIPLELNRYPATPAGYYDGYYPGSRSIEVNRAGFTQKIQRIPELNFYPVAAAPGQPLSAFISPVMHGVSFNQSLQKVELNEFPATAPGYYSGYYPGSIIEKANRSGYRVKRQSLPELNKYPSPAIDLDITALIGHFEPTRNATNRRLKLLPELNVYPLAASIADITAWEPYFKPTRNATNRRTLKTLHDVYPVTPIVISARKAGGRNRQIYPITQPPIGAHANGFNAEIKFGNSAVTLLNVDVSQHEGFNVEVGFGQHYAVQLFPDKPFNKVYEAQHKGTSISASFGHAHILEIESLENEQLLLLLIG